MRRRSWPFAALIGGVHFVFHLFMRLVPPLIPVLSIALGYPLWQLGLLVTGYFTGSSIGLLPMGALSDRYDRRLLLSGALAVVSLGVLGFAYAPVVGASLPAVDVVGRRLPGPVVAMTASMVVAGLGTSAHIPVGIPLLTANAPEGERGRLLGVWGGASKLGDAAAPAAVGLLILVATWREVALIFSAAGVVATLGLFVILGFDRFETAPPGRTEDRTTTTRDLLSNRRGYLYPVLALVGYFAMYNVAVQGAVTFTPTFIADVYAYTLSAGGVRLGPESFADLSLSALLLVAAVSRLAGGVAVDRFDGRIVLVGSLLVAAGALFSFAVATLSAPLMLLVLCVFGAGLWGNSPARDTLISDLTPDEHEGRTFSYLFAASRVFGAASPTFVGFVAGTAGVRQGFTYLAAATALAAGFAALLFSRRVYAPSRAAERPAGD
jgi:MFS family permease